MQRLECTELKVTYGDGDGGNTAVTAVIIAVIRTITAVFPRE